MEYILLAGALLLFFVLIMGAEYLNNRKFLRQCIENVFQSYGKPAKRSYAAGEMGHIRAYYRKHCPEGKIDDITWNDLDLDRIYQKINTSCSAAGDEYLYYRLRTPMYDKTKMEAYERQISYFMENRGKREAVVKELFTLGRSGKYSIYEYLENLELLGERNNRKYLLFDICFLASIGVMFLSLPVGIVALLVIASHNLIDYYKEYKTVEPYVTSFSYIRRVLECAERINKVPLEAFAGEQSLLTERYKKLRGFMRSSYLVISAERNSGSPFEIVLDYFKMLFYLDLIQFNRTLESLRNHIEEVDEIVTVIGKIESAIVIGSYRESLRGAYCVPVFGESEGITIEKAYHPLLDDPVTNSISVSKGVLLTGSNASGKSTFLRAVALCAVLGQTIHTCPAKRYEAPVFRIYSSMSLKDDIVSGDSYYMVEVKSIKRILEQVKQAKSEGRSVLCFVDEVLRGTNTVERIAASAQILKMLAEEKAFCFAATHDVELTKLLGGVYENYHFEEKIVDDDIFFPYQLMKGPAVSRNAIALLKVLGYEEKIITQAEAMAQTFLDTGVWEADWN